MRCRMLPARSPYSTIAGIFTIVRILEPGEDYRSEPRIRLHIVTDWVSGEESGYGSGNMFYLPYRIHEKLKGLSGERFWGMDLVESVTNHDHGEIVESVEVYECRACRKF